MCIVCDRADWILISSFSRSVSTFLLFFFIYSVVRFRSEQEEERRTTERISREFFMSCYIYASFSNIDCPIVNLNFSPVLSSSCNIHQMSVTIAYEQTNKKKEEEGEGEIISI